MTITCSKTNNGVKNERGMWDRITRFVLHLRLPNLLLQCLRQIHVFQRFPIFEVEEFINSEYTVIKYSKKDEVKQSSFLFFRSLNLKQFNL